MNTIAGGIQSLCYELGLSVYGIWIIYYFENKVPK